MWTIRAKVMSAIAEDPNTHHGPSRSCRDAPLSRSRSRSRPRNTDPCVYHWQGKPRKHVCEPFNVRTPRRSNQPDAPARRKGITDRLHIRFTAIVSQLVDPIHYDIGAMLQGNTLSRWDRQLAAAVENCQVRQSSLRPYVANAFCAGIFGGGPRRRATS